MPAAKALESIECPGCGCRRNFVEETRIIDTHLRGKDWTIIRRRRKCKNCRKGFYTTETIEPDDAPEVAPNEVVVFNNLNVKELTRPPSPLDPVRVAPPPAPGDSATQQALETLRNPYLTSPKEDAPLRGAGNGSLGEQPKGRKKKA